MFFSKLFCIKITCSRTLADARCMYPSLMDDSNLFAILSNDLGLVNYLLDVGRAVKYRKERTYLILLLKEYSKHEHHFQMFIGFR